MGLQVIGSGGGRRVLQGRGARVRRRVAAAQEDYGGADEEHGGRGLEQLVSCTTAKPEHKRQMGVNEARPFCWSLPALESILKAWPRASSAEDPLSLSPRSLGPNSRSLQGRLRRRSRCWALYIQARLSYKSSAIRPTKGQHSSDEAAALLVRLPPDSTGTCTYFAPVVMFKEKLRVRQNRSKTDQKQ